jgi:site-specific DNA-adenine methylase
MDASSREAVCNRLAAADKAGYVDCITLSSSLCFAMHYQTNCKGFEGDTLYNRVRFADYDATGYLDGLEVVRCDYRELLHQYRNTPDVLFLADPPYLSTDTSTYSSAAYWYLRDYLDVIKELQGLRFVYFTSNKSQIIDLCEWMSANFNVPNLFAGAQRNVYNAHASATSFTRI